MIRYSVQIDTEACWGCKACEVACKQENNSPYGVKLISVIEEESIVKDGKAGFIFSNRMCRHCENPECMDACSEDAIKKRDDGIVILDSSLCIGCGSCMEVCPYDAIDFDEEKNIAVKCNLCFHRVDAGLIPACADNVCLAHCIHFMVSDRGTQNR